MKDDPQKNSAVSILRGLLSQLIGQCPDLLPFCYDKMRASGEATLSSLELAKKLYEVFCDKLSKQYVVIDGLDECAAEELKNILVYLSRLIDQYDKETGRIRVLIVSQHLNDIQRLVSMAEILPLQSTDNAGDIRCFVQHKMTKIGDLFELKQEQVDEVVANTCAKADGKCRSLIKLERPLTHQGCSSTLN